MDKRHRERPFPSAEQHRNHACFFLVLVLLVAAAMGGCGSMLPVAKSRDESPWEHFENAKEAFEQIVPGKTTRSELDQLRFTPETSPNVHILTYLDLIKVFMPNTAIRLEDLDPGVRECITASADCHAYRIEIEKLRSERYGNVFLDLLRFKRQEHRTGWRFSAMVVLVGDRVVYKIWGGTPDIDEYRYQKNPLGPLQEPASLARDAAVVGAF